MVSCSTYTFRRLHFLSCSNTLYVYNQIEFSQSVTSRRVHRITRILKNYSIPYGNRKVTVCTIRIRENLFSESVSTATITILQEIIRKW